MPLKKEGKDEPFAFDGRKLNADEKVLLTGALVAGEAVKNMFLKAEIAGSGFYQQHAYVDIANVELSNDDLIKVEKEAGLLLKRNQ